MDWAEGVQCILPATYLRQTGGREGECVCMLFSVIKKILHHACTAFKKKAVFPWGWESISLGEVWTEPYLHVIHKRWFCAEPHWPF